MGVQRRDPIVMLGAGMRFGLKHRYTLILLCLVALTVPGGAASAEVPAQIDADTMWTKADSPHVVVEDVLVAEGATLTVEAGATVEISAGRSVFVRGTLVARGTEAAPILFTGSNEEDERWGSVVFEDSSEDASFTDDLEYTSGSVLEGCVFEHATKAVQTLAASPYIHASTFRFNRCPDNEEKLGGAALYIGPGSAPWVHGCTFEGNAAAPIAQGGAVVVDDASPTIQGNTFTQNSSVYGGALMTNRMMSPIVGNTFDANDSSWEGGAVALYSSSPAFVGNVVTGNTAIADGGGVHVCVDCFPHANPFVTDNTITGNSNKAHHAAGFGAAYLRVFAGNVIYDNLQYTKPYDFGWYNEHLESEPSWVVHPKLAGNWWGTSDRAAIDETIVDGKDEETYGVVAYEPLDVEPVGPAPPRVFITARQIRYRTPTKPMEVFVTVTNPGEAQTIELIVLLQYGDGAPVPFRGDLGIPGSAAADGVYSLSMPAGSVRFSKLLAPPYREVPEITGGAWHAALYDPETGERHGDVCSSRFELGEEGAK